MRFLLFILSISLIFNTINGQILNGDFEDGLNSDLSNWEWSCFAEPNISTPPGGGNWSIKVWGGNTQGCFPGSAYQVIPSITNGQTFQLTGWAFAQEFPPVGLYLGKINSGNITLLAGDTTSSTSWTQLGVQSTLPLELGDTAIVLLNGGLAGGPFQGYGYFDLINLQPATGINTLELQQSFKLSPNPFNNQTTLYLNQSIHNGSITISNTFGQVVQRIENINNQRIIIERGNLNRGLYVMCLSENNKVIAQTKLFITDD
ncbi:MAG: T9SS type A sorting domain-containing protein [Candidatus Marinimicrobia bacterium]|nr:T9SS type A sorting domain-containing protein [Candidatus Neomarinimicrobiota bacterium]